MLVCTVETDHYCHYIILDSNLDERGEQPRSGGVHVLVCCTSQKVQQRNHEYNENALLPNHEFPWKHGDFSECYLHGVSAINVTPYGR